MQISEQNIENGLIFEHGIAWDKGLTEFDVAAARNSMRELLEAALSTSTDAEPVKTAPAVAVKADEVDAIIEELLDAQQDINLAANSTMDQSLCDASALIDRVEILLNRVKASALSAQVQDVAGWQSMDTAPKDGTVIQAWHTVHKCPISILWNNEGHDFNGESLHWFERSYTTAWPEHAFSHWMPLPAAPAKQEGGTNE